MPTRLRSPRAALGWTARLCCAAAPLFSPVALGGCAAPAAPAPAAPASEARPAAEAATPLSQGEALEVFDAAWAAIDETHFDPTFNGVDWNAVRAELRPRAERAASREELRSVLRDMLARLGQSHFALLPAEYLPSAPDQEPEGGADPAAEGSLGGASAEAVAQGELGLDVRLREGRVLVTELFQGGAAEAAGVRTGWVVRSVGDVDIAGLAPELEGEDPDPRHVAYMVRERVLEETYGPVGSPATLVFVDEADREVRLELERRTREAEAYSMIATLPTVHLRFESETLVRGAKRVGRIHFTNWFLPMMRPIDEAVDGMRGHDGIVLDLRGNSGGAAAMVMGVGGHFFRTREKLGEMTLRTGPMQFIANPRLVAPGGRQVEPFAGPVAILVDETTGSASEVFAGGMQSTGRVRVFGETTAGAVLLARTTRLPNGDALLHAMADFVTADGTRLEGRGVVPDELVPLRREDLLAGKDAPLERALDWIDESSS